MSRKKKKSITKMNNTQKVPEKSPKNCIDSDKDEWLRVLINSKVTTKDIRDSLWRCRDFELSHLWQRSIFLTTLLILCYTGYGIVVMKLIEEVNKGIPSLNSSVYVLNNTALLLCLIGVVFSCLWIMMAKGSKAWYERYESAIDAFEGNKEYMDNNTFTDQDKAIGGFQYKNIPRYVDQEISSCIFNCKGGAYSPSRINIAIGQISFTIWGITLSAHFFLHEYNFCIDQCLLSVIIPWLIFLTFIITLISQINYIPDKIRAYSKSERVWLKSKELREVERIQKKRKRKISIKK